MGERRLVALVLKRQGREDEQASKTIDTYKGIFVVVEYWADNE